MLVALGVGVDEFVFDESSVDRKHCERVDRLVRLGDFGPGVVVVDPQIRGMFPREARIVERVEREQHGLIPSRSQRGEHLLAVLGP